jgi:hypothetical protein
MSAKKFSERICNQYTALISPQISTDIGVIFMNDGIDTRDKDGELRLTIMASIAQEESRKTSERVKWGIRRKMENGWVYGNNDMLGYEVKNGTLTVIPEEAEIIRRIFHSYAYEKKGSHTIANELNAEGYFTKRGKIWREDAVIRVIKNDKYVGDLTQWKHYSTDFLTKKVVQNNGDNPEVPLITISNHHEPIIDRETWNLATAQIKERGALSREGKRYSQHYWYSSKVYCGKCGWAFGVTGAKNKLNRSLRCVNRAKYGAEQRVDSNGAEVGCDIKFINEKVLSFCMKYILEHIQSSQEEIISDLLLEIKAMQKDEKAVDIKVFENGIENMRIKKRKAIDLMIEGLISKDDLKEQTAFYESEIARLSEEMNQSQNINSLHEMQIDKVKSYINEVKKTAEINSDNTEIYGEMLERIVVFENEAVDYYLKCVPFGFRIEYHTIRYNRGHKLDIVVDSLAIVA